MSRKRCLVPTLGVNRGGTLIRKEDDVVLQECPSEVSKPTQRSPPTKKGRCSPQKPSIGAGRRKNTPCRINQNSDEIPAEITSDSSSKANGKFVQFAEEVEVFDSRSEREYWQHGRNKITQREQGYKKGNKKNDTSNVGAARESEQILSHLLAENPAIEAGSTQMTWQQPLVPPAALQKEPLGSLSFNNDKMIPLGYMAGQHPYTVWNPPNTIPRPRNNRGRGRNRNSNRMPPEMMMYSGGNPYMNPYLLPQNFPNQLPLAQERNINYNIGPARPRDELLTQNMVAEGVPVSSLPSKEISYMLGLMRGVNLQMTPGVSLSGIEENPVLLGHPPAGPHHTFWNPPMTPQATSTSTGAHQKTGCDPKENSDIMPALIVMDSDSKSKRKSVQFAEQVEVHDREFKLHVRNLDTMREKEHKEVNMRDDNVAVKTAIQERRQHDVLAEERPTSLAPGEKLRKEPLGVSLNYEANKVQLGPPAGSQLIWNPPSTSKATVSTIKKPDRDLNVNNDEIPSEILTILANEVEVREREYSRRVKEKVKPRAEGHKKDKMRNDDVETATQRKDRLLAEERAATSLASKKKSRKRDRLQAADHKKAPGDSLKCKDKAVLSERPSAESRLKIRKPSKPPKATTSSRNETRRGQKRKNDGVPTEIAMDSGSDDDVEFGHLDEENEPYDEEDEPFDEHRLGRAYARRLRDETLCEKGYEEDSKRSDSEEYQDGLIEDSMPQGRSDTPPASTKSHLEIGKPQPKPLINAPSPKKARPGNNNDEEKNPDIFMDSGSEGDSDNVDQFDEEDEAYNILSERAYARRLRNQMIQRENRCRKEKVKNRNYNVESTKKCMKTLSGRAIAETIVANGLTETTMSEAIEVSGVEDELTCKVMAEETDVGAVEYELTDELMVKEIIVGAVEEVLIGEAMAEATVVAEEDGIIDALMVGRVENELINEVMAKKIVGNTSKNKEVQEHEGLIVRGVLKDTLIDKVITEQTLVGEGENTKKLENDDLIQTSAVQYMLTDKLTAKAKEVIQNGVGNKVIAEETLVGAGEDRVTEEVIDKETVLDFEENWVTQEKKYETREASPIEYGVIEEAMVKKTVVGTEEESVTEEEIDIARVLSAVEDRVTDEVIANDAVIGAGKERVTEEEMVASEVVSAVEDRITDEVIDKDISEARDALTDRHLSFLMAEETMACVGDKIVTGEIVKDARENNQAKEYEVPNVSCAVKDLQRDKMSCAIQDKQEYKVSAAVKGEQKHKAPTERRVTGTEEEESLEQATLAQTDEDHVFSWTEDYSTFTGQQETYLRSPGPKIRSQDPVQIFMEIWNKTILETIVNETNNYAWQVLAKMSDTEKGIPSYLDIWTETDIPEIYRYFAMLILMSLCYRSRFRDYWTTNILELPALRKVMAKNRFNIITKFLHFTNNDSIKPGLSSYDKKIFKIRPLLDHCNSKFASLYVPNKHLSLDESLLLWKGRLSWTQCIRTKAARFGIKSYELCEAVTGYQLKCLLYAGKDSTMCEKPINGFENCTAKVVLELMDGYLDVGHTLVMDNWYNQLSLTRFLKKRRTDVIGTMNPRRVNVPDDIKLAHSASLARGELIARHCGDISLVAWADVKLVTAISTYHTNSRVTVQRNKEPIEIPASINDYNKYMGGVDTKDQKLSMFLMERKRGKKWYMKVFKRLLNTSLMNAYIIFTRNPTLKPLSHRDFRYEVAMGLLQKFCVTRTLPPERSFSLDKNVLRLMKADHFVENTEKIPGKNKHKQRRCVRCTTLGRRTMVTLVCRLCRVALCAGPCWADYHTLKDLKKTPRSESK